MLIFDIATQVNYFYIIFRDELNINELNKNRTREYYLKGAVFCV